MPALKSTSRKSVWPPHPPPNESEEATRMRMEEEAEAKRVSESIDRALLAERELLKKRHSGAKILLLGMSSSPSFTSLYSFFNFFFFFSGQAESGKSTVLKNFQLRFSPKAFEAEAIVWCPVIHLNLVRSVNFILNLLNDSARSPRESSTQSPGQRNGPRRYLIRLAPLRHVEESLAKKISGLVHGPHTEKTIHYHPSRASEVELRPGSGWKGLFKLKRQADTNDTDDSNRRILAACADDILRLWADPAVQECLASNDIVLEDQPGFFLEDVKRVTQENYQPTPADVLRARVATMGPEEHHIQVESGLSDKARHWTIYDVGGSRSQRAAWAQFFDDVNVIIFLAPISAFNQTLAEDDGVNRLVDSMRLWEQICANKILASVELILFLNKLDILDAKLKSGIQLATHITSYSDRPNDTKHVAKYLRDVFIALHQQYSPKKRKLHPHLTCAIDTNATSSIITRIQEIVLVKMLAQSSIL
ncbi:hypothetical protein AX14_012498 [Amanita brunnescens Koide BX004]|nr:hypothetical protein AX14_012498 [Amanita brunnescens Koide BX004]